MFRGRIHEPSRPGPLCAYADPVRAIGLICASAAVVISCVRPIDVHTASLKTAPFDRYRTFSFAAPEGSPSGYRVSTRSAEVRLRVKPLIVAELQQKGYALAPAKGDFVIAYGTGRREVDLRHPGPAHDWLDENEDDDFTEASIVIDVFDGSNDGQVWHGATRAGIDPDRVDQAQLERSVRLILAPYPAAAVAVAR
jgi:hypothetical protein